jgi:hypothetical protein
MILGKIAEFFVSVLIHHLAADWIRGSKKSYNPIIRVIPSLFAESGRGRDLTMRFDCRERRQDGKCAYLRRLQLPTTSEQLHRSRKVPLLPSFGVQNRDDNI